MNPPESAEYKLFKCPACNECHEYIVRIQGKYMTLECKNCEASTCFKKPEGL